MPLDPQMLKLQAQVDQTRAEVRVIVHQMPKDEVVALIKASAANQFDEMDHNARQLVGMLAVVAIFDLYEKGA